MCGRTQVSHLSWSRMVYQTLNSSQLQREGRPGPAKKKSLGKPRERKVQGLGGQTQVQRDTKEYQGGSGTVNKWDKVVTGAPVANARCSAGHETHIEPGYLLV